MMSGSVLVFGSTSKNREAKVFQIVKNIDFSLVEKENADLLVIAKEPKKKNIGIDKVRKATKFLSTKPYNSQVKVVVIHSADKLTAQAQNALLKTLEEPPSYATIILNSKSENSLLPTIISRCRKIKVGDITEEEHEVTTKYELEDLRKIGIGKKMELAPDMSKKDREEVIAFIEDIIFHEREQMLEDPSVESSRFIKKALEIKVDLEDTNVNARLALENLLING